MEVIKKHTPRQTHKNITAHATRTEKERRKSNGKKVYRVISDSVEIYASKTLHRKYLPDSLTAEEIFDLYLAQDYFYEKKVCDCATYEDAVKACDKVRIVTVKGGYNVPAIMAEVAYVREITLEIDDEDGSEIDIIADNGIRYYRAKEYHA